MQVLFDWQFAVCKSHEVLHEKFSLRTTKMLPGFFRFSRLILHLMLRPGDVFSDALGDVLDDVLG